MSGELYVCGIGASAGGLAPLEEFFDAVPAGSGLAYVVVQHLSPDHESMMANLLGHHTDMTIAQAIDGALLEPDHIYLIPPSTEMTVFGGRLRLRARRTDSGDVPRPISLFFNSLASEFGAKAIAIVLSGSGSDGADGLESVRRAGGLTIAQDQTAAFGSMPDSARATGMVDATLNPGEMPEMVIDFTRGRRRQSETVVSLDAPELRILRAVSDSSDIDFTQYKSSTIHRRIGRRATLTRSSGLDDYADLVERNAVERELLVEDLLIDVSAFFRDAPAWASIEHELTRLLTESEERKAALRIWSAATSTGEEAYSLAMLAVEARERASLRVPIQIFATDVHRGSLATAGAGSYGEVQMEGVSAARRERFFTHSDGTWHVRKELRSLVTFAHHNLLNDAPFTRMDLVTCRNMLIYLRNAAQETALSLLSVGLRTGGVLMLGPSETASFLERDLSTIDRTWRIFRKEGESAIRSARRIPAVATAMASSPVGRVPRPTITADQRLLRAYDAILDSQFVAGMLVDEAGELVHTFGKGTQLMAPPRGRPTLDVVQLIDDAVLRVAVSAVLNRLTSPDAPDEVRRAVVLPDGIDLSNEADGSTEHGPPRNGVLHGRRLDLGTARYVLLYLRPVEVEADAAVAPTTDDLGAQAEIDRLLEDLVYTRESLQTAVEQQETVNEELNATNEELLAANEELQSTNEELSSVNEELLTLNDEHQRQLEDVLQLTADLEVLLASVSIAAILLNQDGTIRRITEPAKSIFGVRDSDIGRPLADLATNLDRGALLLDIRNVAQGGPAVTRPVELDGDAAYRLLVDRYELPHDAPGVYLAVFSSTLVGPGEGALRKVLDSAPVALYAKDGAGVYTAMNEWGARRIEGAVGQSDLAIFPAEIAAGIVATDDAVRASGEVLVRHETPSGPDGPFDVISMKFPMADGGVGGVTIPIGRDLREIAEVVGLAGPDFASFLQQAPIGIAVVDRDGRLTAMNLGADVNGAMIGDVAPAIAENPSTLDTIHRVLETGRAESTFVPDADSADGSGRRVFTFPMQDGKVGTIGFVAERSIDTTIEAANDDEVARLRAKIIDLGGDPDA